MIRVGRELISTIVVSLAFVGTAAKPVGELRMGSVVQVSATGENVKQVWAYSDPTDGRHLIACGMLSNSVANATYGYVYSSADAGLSWHRALLDHATGWVSEESCAYGQDGRAYFVAGESDTSTGSPRHQWGHLQVFVSQDHGMTWKPSGRREFVDWTLSVALPPDKRHSEFLLIFGNMAADEPGHWFEKQPVVLEATNGGQTLSQLVTPTMSSSANFGGGSVTLPDRTALFAVAASDLKGDSGTNRQVKLFAYKSSKRSFVVRSTLRNEPGREVGLPFMTRDSSHKFHGRLYAAWPECARLCSDVELWLASSDDDGYHWSTHAILSVADYRTPTGCPTDFSTAPPDIRVAVNQAGTLAVLWDQNGQNLLLALSFNGGRTFQAGQLVAQQPSGELSLDDAIPFNEWLLGENLATQQGKSGEFIRPFLDQSHLGLSVRLSKHRGIGDFALTADAKKVFHTFWTGIDRKGNYALMTRKIYSQSAAGATTYPMLTTSAAASACGEDTAHLKAEGPSPIPPLEISGQTDVSRSLNLLIDHVDYAAESHIVTATVTLINKNGRSLRGPFSFFALGLHSDFGVATPLNASGTRAGQPFWDLSAMIPAIDLPPKTSGKPIRLQFKIDQFRSVPIGDAVAMQIRVFAQNATQ